MTPNADWYQAGGLFLSGLICLTMFTAITIHAKVQHWYVWLCGIAGVALMLSAGTYLARTSVARGTVAFIKEWPIVSFVVFLAVFWGVASLVRSLLPKTKKASSGSLGKGKGDSDSAGKAVTTAGITMGVAVFAFLLPVTVGFIPGKIGARIDDTQATISNSINKHTKDSFRPGAGGDGH
jgi:hypothetical protein